LRLRASVAEARPIPCIHVLAGTNGAGKSSILGAMISESEGEYFNPDDATQRILARNPSISLARANSEAWYEGKRLLERAIGERLNYAFETTLGGETITSLLERAIVAKIAVRIWYVGLDSPERNLERVRARVRKGGHDIPEKKVRERYRQGLIHLIRLLPYLSDLLVYDNSEEADPDTGKEPEPKLLLHLEYGKIVSTCDLSIAPQWVKPILAAALKLDDTWQTP
jgi:predicted ABC-type ATPase